MQGNVKIYKCTPQLVYKRLGKVLRLPILSPNDQFRNGGYKLRQAEDRGDTQDEG